MLRDRSIFVCLSAFFLLSSPLAHGLTLHEALARVASHPALAPLALEEERATARAGDAGRRGPDTLALDLENVGGDLNGLTETEATLALSRPLLDRHRVRAARTLAALDGERARFAQARRRWELSSAVQRTFHALQAAIALAEVASEAVDLATDLRDATLVRVEAGSSPPAERLSADLTLERARAELKQRQGAVRQLLQELARATGAATIQASEIEGQLSPDLTLPDRATLEANLLATHPALRQLALDRREAAGQLAQARADTRPEWAISGGLRHLRAAEARDRLTFVIGLEASLPSPRATRGARQALALRQAQIEAEERQQRHELLTTLAEAVERFTTARAVALDLRDRVLPAALRLHELALDGYRLGKTSQLAVYDARQTLLASRREYFQSLDELYQAVDTIEQLCGVCLVGESH
ncbi:MAG: Heavy metal RND efflux outer membrane protein, CzcC family [Candidatus Ozemobacter sibiricus]|jgi:outer membrane protein TolC|uniref:Heavy metal RND efflux outer membrane protein, CzcC family n=1 Tax=Candidatus Ozemobacter sibiricus TaxID=2268124 RepID=A0A367ZKW2_9BACT|nr:MAG: Heavy metal RND efflux outer membrane protein, CzcC family [Candidatus Ozemobacter sibiricus]